MMAKMAINGQPARLIGDNTDKIMLLPTRPHDAPTATTLNVYVSATVPVNTRCHQIILNETIIAKDLVIRI